jgi:hypothetical protein
VTATVTLGDRLAAEAARYLEVVEQFAALDADPHAEARGRAARARAREQACRRRPTLRRRHGR